MSNLYSVLSLTRFQSFEFVCGGVCACIYVCVLVCLHCKYADLKSLKQIKFARHVLLHKAVELGLRVWVVD